VHLGEPTNPGLIFQTHNLLSSRPVLNQEGQHLTNLMLNDEIVK
jgi:hypothetical protein